jgi:methylmalonyl-CoA mutase
LIAKLSDAGVPVEKIAKKIKFNFGVTSNYFPEIAKFRAARWLWAEIVKAYLPACDCPAGCCGDDCCKEGFCRCACMMMVHARTTEWNMTVYDAYVNLLRTQTEAMSAALAGVDSITVLPYDCIFKTPDEFSEGIARNQQLLLKEECDFDKTADPAGGSYYVEVLTQSLADAAWRLFLETVDSEGFAVKANKGDVQRAVNETNKSRRNRVATRRQVLIGTNQYPNFAEKAGVKADDPTGCNRSGDSSDNSAVTSISIDSSKWIEGSGDSSDNSAVTGCPGNNDFDSEAEGTVKLDFSRGASEFETLRFAVEKSGKTPKVFILPIGNLSMRLARSQFSTHFFACAGYEIIDNPGFQTIEEGINAARRKQADIIVLCSSDDEYATFAPEAFRLTGGKERLVVAGAPACMDELKAGGIEFFIHLKSNVLDSLRKLKTI